MKAPNPNSVKADRGLSHVLGWGIPRQLFCEIQSLNHRPNAWGRVSKVWLTCLACLALLALSVPIYAQSFSISWYKVSGGGGTSSNGQYTVTGTIGQHDAGGPMTGGSFSLTGGFWALYALETPNAPRLYISHTDNTVTVYWQDVAGWTLQQNGDVGNPAGWVLSGYTITTANGTNSITINPPAGNLYFRLK